MLLKGETFQQPAEVIKNLVKFNNMQQILHSSIFTKIW